MFPNQTDGFLKGVTIGTITAGTTQTQAGGTLITKGIQKVTTGNANDGVLLPRADTNNSIGQAVVVSNLSANIVKVYPFYDTTSSTASGGTVDGGAANAALSQAASIARIYVCTGINIWVSALLS